ncbi:hypothetical protein HYPBUDRAFT_217772 [Hyphopichia burtonii NRRL Y-1933]|uniref:Uncharacterized protein n=1 Tax=Hyphopichia burtonii NRRL Y-1933 TaxID=984485 RepID=A0A1E4RHP4_9ASCO|nr:hypothetical protein HYPBUDRAFT_217772 [Hyphopichia burtonii NRRL Y-1933]ODV66741.1 hypothetical protein HYPBUDRAFT_217772 [Hyphopichia burtonii NRRL Y-1933]
MTRRNFLQSIPIAIKLSQINFSLLSSTWNSRTRFFPNYFYVKQFVLQLDLFTPVF